MQPEQIGPALQRMRQERGMTQGELAQKAGVTPTIVSKYESGRHLPQTANLLAILNAMGADIAELGFTIRSMLFDAARRAVELQGPVDRPDLVQARAALHMAQMFAHFAELFRLWSSEPYFGLVQALGRVADLAAEPPASPKADGDS